MGRGKQTKPTKGIRTEDGRYLRGPEQLQVQRLQEKLKRSLNKIVRLKAQRQTLIKNNRDMARALLASDQPIALKNASAKFMESAIRNSLQFWTPLSITVAQLEQEYYVLNLAGVETMRKIQKNVNVRHSLSIYDDVLQNTIHRGYQNRLANMTSKP